MSQPVAKPLEQPVRELVGDALDDRAIDRGFRAVQQRRAAKPAQSPPRRLAVVAAVAIAACVALFFVFRTPAPGALARVDGLPLDTLEAGAGAPPARADLSDGSSLEIAPGGRFVTMGNDGNRFIALLERGKATVHVQKGGPRAWTIECGLATVDVVGTRFSLDRSGGALRVEVEEGLVLVRGENVPDRARRLTGGESIVVHEPTASTPGASSNGAGAPAPSAMPTSSGTASAAANAGATASWRELAKSGSFKEAYAALGDGGVKSATSAGSVDDLFLLADVARLSGHPGEAVAPLERIVAEHGGDGRAALAALTLARLRLDSLGQAGRAAQDFETALAMGLPASLQEDAMGRAVEARYRSGDREGGKRVAERYLARFPAGRYAATIQKLMEEKP